MIILDPVNHGRDQRARSRAASKNYIGGNCTVSLMLMAHGRALQGRISSNG